MAPVVSQNAVIALWVSSPARHNQSDGHRQQHHPGEEDGLRGVRRADGGLAEMLRHVR